MNGIRPMLNAIPYNVPTIDGDLMGRAYPRLYIMTPYGEPPEALQTCDGD